MEHYEECWRDHHDCAIDEIGKLQSKVASLHTKHPAVKQEITKQEFSASKGNNDEIFIYFEHGVLQASADPADHR